MKERLLGILCCPKCKADFELVVSGSSGGEVKEGTLKCRGCGDTYEVRNFIPRFVESDKYVGNFSFEWLFYKRTQLDSHNRTSGSLDSFVQKTGFTPAELKDRLVLDVGCGTGRYMEIAAGGGAEVVGVDLSYSVESAVENMRGRQNTNVVQADIFNLPFKPGIFDFIYSIGVLHHTPDTRKAFLSIVPLLRVKGNISIWVYSNESWFEHMRNACTDFYRIFTTRMPVRLLWLLCHLAIPLYYLKKMGKFGQIFEIFLPSANTPDVEERVLDTFDWYSPKYQFKHTYAEVEGWFTEAGLTSRRLGFSVAVTGSRPV
jgi:SAM-dependent methyltransferase